jgi:hypothetical protein
MTGKNKIYIFDRLNEIKEIAARISHANIYDKDFPIKEDFKDVKRLKKLASMIENNLIKRL